MRLRTILPLVAMLAVPAMAQDVHFGINAGLNFPQGGGSNVVGSGGYDISAKDAVDSKLGFAIGINVPINFDGGHTLRPRIDYTHNSGTPSDNLFPSGSGVDGKAESTFIGADYLYHFSGKNDGGYVVGGLGYAHSKLEFTAGGASLNDSKSAFAWTLGGGWQINPMFGAELRYTSTEPTLNFNGADFKFKNDGFVLAATFTF